MGVAGNLKTMLPGDLLQWLSLGQKTGTLIVTKKAVEKKIFLKRGRVISSASNDPREYLGQFLMSHGYMSEPELMKAMQVQSESNILLGKILVMIDVIDEESLQRLMRRKAEEAIYDIFLWREGEFSFIDDELPTMEMIPLQVDVTGLIMEGTRRVDEWQRIRLIIPNETLVPASGGAAATRYGEVVGTPSFMPPEQAAGQIDRLGPASDVYSLGATLYCLLTGRDPECVIAVCRYDQGTPIAFQRFVPCKAGTGLSLDTMRRDAVGPNGVNERLIVEVVLWAREHGIREVSLNFAAFRGLIEDDAELGPLQSAQAWLIRRLNPYFQIQSLLTFNAKFNPRWVPRYIVYRSVGDLAPVAVAALSAESFLPFDRGPRCECGTAGDESSGTGLRIGSRSSTLLA